MSDSKRVQLILTEEMVNELKETAEQRNTNFSALARLALAEWIFLNKRVDIDHRLKWGGVREQNTIAPTGGAPLLAKAADSASPSPPSQNGVGQTAG